MSRVNELPDNKDSEFWGDAETHILRPKKIDICESHNKNDWMNHKGYLDNHDGTISCKYCPWGTKIPGYIKLHDDRVVDIRTLRNKLAN